MATILIVDDEEVIRRGCKRAFVAEGYRVLTAANGHQALDLLAAEMVDVILCDLKMPGMGALDVLMEIKKRLPQLPPLIVITGQGTTRNAVECIKAGAYDFITKPFRIESLVTLVKLAKEGKPPPSRFPDGKLPI
jgi:DNA-binding NtrC family response regulator